MEIHFAFSLGLSTSFETDTHPVNRMTAFDVQLKFLYQLMFEFHLYQFGSLGKGDDSLIRFLVLNLDWYYTHTENLIRTNCCTLGVSDIGTITLDYLCCLIIIR